MAEFLSPAWVVELDAALQGSSLRAADASEACVVYELQAQSSDGRAHTHHVTIDASGVHATYGPAPKPDLVLVTDFGTALSLHHNDRNAQAAIASGALRIRGDLDAFSRHAAVIAALDDVFSALRAATTIGASSDDGDR